MMELTISREDLVRGLALAHKVADPKSPMPILASVLLSADASGRLRFAATDLCISISARVEATVRRAGAVAAHARMLFEIVKSLPEGNVKLSVDRQHALLVHSGAIHFRVPGAPGDDFPTLPRHHNSSFTELDADTLRQLIERTHYAMSDDDARPHLAGALLESDGSLVRMVATDGHRLSKAEAAAQVAPLTMLLPRKGVVELRRMLEALDETRKLGIALVDGCAFFHAGDVVLRMKVGADQFPPYSKIIPRASTRRVVVGRKPMLQALQRVSLVARDSAEGLRLAAAPGKLEITGESQTAGEGREQLAVDFAGARTQAAFHGRYRLDVLTALEGEEIALELGSEFEPGVVKPVGDASFVGVVMPMRMQEEAVRALESA